MAYPGSGILAVTRLLRYQVWLDAEHVSCVVSQTSEGCNLVLIFPDVWRVWR